MSLRRVRVKSSGDAAVANWVAEMVDRYPMPPRPFDRWLLIRRIVLSKDTLFLSALGTVLVAVAVWGLVSGAVDTRTFGGFLAFSGFIFGLGGGALLLFSPLVYFRRVARALEQGVLVQAEVMSTKIGHTRPQGREEAAGERLVQHPLGPFRAPFRFSYVPWLSQMHQGSIMHVLVHPEKHKILWELGMAGTSSGRSTAALQ